MPLVLSPLYPIFDASYLPVCRLHGEVAGRWEGANQGMDDPDFLLPGEQARRQSLTQMVQALGAAGVTMLQYRNKRDHDLQVLRDAAWLRKQAPRSLRIILNDRVNLVKASGCDGVHVGQGDWSPKDARLLLGADCIIGLSTHDAAQLGAGDAGDADYLAIGPVYETGSKADAEGVVGLEGVRQARALTRKPLVAIGGITLARAAEVRAAGADSLAVISALFGGSGTPLHKLAKDFLKVFR